MAVKYFKFPFAVAGDVTPVPNDVQPDGSVSYTQGYGVDYSLDPSVNPDALQIERAKWNQIMNDVTTAIQQYQQHGIPDFITTADNGGSPYEYAKYSMVLFDNGSGIQAFQSLVDANDDDPSVAASWALMPLGSVPNVYVGGVTTGSANAQVAATLGPLGITLKNGTTIIAEIGFSNTGAVTLNGGATGVINIKKPSLAGLVPLTGGEMILGNMGMWSYDLANTCWVLMSTDFSFVRQKLAANTTYYIATTGSNVTGTGSVSAPWATLQFAWNWIQKNTDLNGFTVTIQMADGTYSTSFVPAGAMIGQIAPENVVLQGNTGTPGNTVVTSSAASAIDSKARATFICQYFKLTTTGGGGNCLTAEEFSLVRFGPGMQFGACVGAHVDSGSHSIVQFLNNYTINGNAAYHWLAPDGGEIICAGLTVTLTGTPAFSQQFANAGLLGEINAVGNTFSGSATGVRYQAQTGGVIYTAGALTTYLPGNSAGTGTNFGVSPYGMYA